MIFSHCVKVLFHTTIKRQNGYSRFSIPISTVHVTKHPLFLKISLSLLPNALLCSLLPNFLLLLSPIMKPWISLPRRFFLYWSLKFERFGVWKCWFEIWFGFKDLGTLLKFDIWKIWSLKVLIWDLIWVLFGFRNNEVLMFEVVVWLYLWEFGWFC